MKKGATKRKDTKRIVLRTGEYQRANGTYEYRWVDKNNKRRCVYAKTLEELRQKEDSLEHDRIEGLKTDKCTINQMYYKWVELKRGLKTNTFENYKYMYETFVYPSFGKKALNSIKRSDVRKFYNSLYENHRLKIATIDCIHSVLLQVFDLAVDDDYLRYNPCKLALKEIKKIVDVDAEKRKALTYEQQQAFMNYIKDHQTFKKWYPLFVVLFNTGMRIGEMAGLRWCDIDLDERTISINHTLVYYCDRSGGENECKFTINTPKTIASNRIIPMTNAVKEAFIQEKKYQEDHGLKCLAEVDGYTDFVFINRYGLNHHQATVNRAIKRIVQAYNIENVENTDYVFVPSFSCHICRHTFATRMCEAGVNIKIIQDVLGHSDIATTMNIYTDATESFKQHGITEFGEKLKEMENSSKHPPLPLTKNNTTF